MFQRGAAAPVLVPKSGDRPHRLNLIEKMNAKRQNQWLRQWVGESAIQRRCLTQLDVDLEKALDRFVDVDIKKLWLLFRGNLLLDQMHHLLMWVFEL